MSTWPLFGARITTWSIIPPGGAAQSLTTVVQYWSTRWHCMSSFTFHHKFSSMHHVSNLYSRIYWLIRVPFFSGVGGGGVMEGVFLNNEHAINPWDTSPLCAARILQQNWVLNFLQLNWEESMAPNMRILWIMVLDGWNLARLMGGDDGKHKCFHGDTYNICNPGHIPLWNTAIWRSVTDWLGRV